MDDLSSKLSELLNDPDSMARVRHMAESILGESAEEKESPTPQIGDIGQMLGSDELKGMMSVISHMKNSSDDNRVMLLNALKPHLGEERQKRADTAIKILKLLDMLPLLKESGFLNIL